MNLENYKKIYNGADTFIYDSIKKNENYKYICAKKFSNQSLDYENNDLYWRQFSKIYWYAQSKNEMQINSRLIKYLITLLRKYLTLE